MNGAATESLVEAIAIKAFGSTHHCFLFIFTSHAKGQHYGNILRSVYLCTLQDAAYKSRRANAKQVSWLLRLRVKSLVIYTLGVFPLLVQHKSFLILNIRLAALTLHNLCFCC